MIVPPKPKGSYPLEVQDLRRTGELFLGAQMTRTTWKFRGADEPFLGTQMTGGPHTRQDHLKGLERVGTLDSIDVETPRRELSFSIAQA